jgi:hypothetical protein
MTTTVSGLSVASAAGVGAASPYWILRIGAALCFIGHGAFGFIAKAAWVPYFGVVGIPEPWAWDLMPVVGAIDVLAGMAMLFGPTRLPLIYMTAWALWTALLRPLAGESGFEALERAGNYGVPLALLVWSGRPRSWPQLLEDLPARCEDLATLSTVRRVLQATTCLLLLGHGALGVLGTPTLAAHYGALDLPVGTSPLIGWLEIFLASFVAVRPTPTLLGLVAGWKLLSESLFLVAGAPIWEFVERSGSYAAPLALAILLARARRGDERGFRVGKTAGGKSVNI